VRLNQGIYVGRDEVARRFRCVRDSHGPLEVRHGGYGAGEAKVEA